MVVRVASLAAAEAVAAAKPAFAAEAVPEASGLSPNVAEPIQQRPPLISYHLSSAGPVKLVIYNVLGQPVRTLVDESRAAGSYRVTWDARDEGGRLSVDGDLHRATELSWRGGDATVALPQIAQNGRAGSVILRTRPETPAEP